MLWKLNVYRVVSIYNGMKVIRVGISVCCYGLGGS